MVFSAPTFLFIFLPLVLVLTHVAPRAWGNTVLLLASLFFYAWGEGEFVALMLASIGLNYAAGLLIDLGRRHGRPAAPGIVLAIAVAANLGILVAFKYAAFLADALIPISGLALDADVREGLESIHLPIGISFFTFQAISYLVDVRRGEHPAQRSPIDLGLFIALFPQLIAGPIVRYKELASQLAERTIRIDEVAVGVRRFTIGLSKKVLLANPLGRPADAIFALPTADLSPSVAAFGVLCYSLQIYFDFSGYSDMAIGLGRLFGFRLPENFAAPYRARSVTEFWRRWHMSLSNWFRDYLYIPLGGSRVAPWKTYRNLLTVFLLCGLWHGASWNFVVWGALHGAFLVLERAGLGRRLERLPRLATHAYALSAVALAWVFFRAETLAGAIDFLGALAGLGSVVPGSMIADHATLETVVVLVVALVVSAVDPERWVSAIEERLETLHRSGARPIAAALSSAPTAALAGLWLLCGMKLASRTYDPFLYFRF